MSAKKYFQLLAGALLMGSFVLGCSTASNNQTTPTEPSSLMLTATTTSLPATATSPPATATRPVPTQTKSVITATNQPAGYPLAEPGPYYVGRRNFELVDATRDNRPVSIIVWYPALLSEGSTGTAAMREAAPDFSGAPYPVILSTTKPAGEFAPVLVSHGFSWVSVSRLDTYDPWDENLFTQPLDLLFALDQVSTHPPEGLEGMLDTDHAGATGYSYDGYNALALSGPRIDPAFYLGICADQEAAKSGLIRLWNYVCAPAASWDDFYAAAGSRLTDSQDGLWQPMTDERIRAVVPLAGEGWWLYGEKGLAAANRPTLIIAATNDGLYEENAWIYEQLQTTEKTMISFIGPSHIMIYEPEMVARMAHFAAAFFGYHLQGREDLAWYYSEEFVNQHKDLAWGVYSGN